MKSWPTFSSRLIPASRSATASWPDDGVAAGVSFGGAGVAAGVVAAPGGVGSASDLAPEHAALSVAISKSAVTRVGRTMASR
ncbi:hypothetical protein GCM10009677_14220 [Sphaerisporangium rubeum]